MDLFGDFMEFGVFTIAFLAIALIGGAAALIKKQYAKRIMIGVGVLEAAVVISGLVYFATLKDAAGTVFEGVGLGKGLYSLMVGLLIVVMAAIMVLSGRKNRWTPRDIANAAVCVAMSFILSCIKLFEMPQGGTITPASLLPMMIYIVAFGPARGLVVGFAYGLLQLFQGAYIIHPIQMLVDYPMAFGALALGGVVKYIKMPETIKLPAAVLLGYIGRYIMAVLSGVIFFAEYAGEEGALVYSLVYNISYLGPDCVVCMAVSLIPGFGRLVKTLQKR